MPDIRHIIRDIYNKHVTVLYGTPTRAGGQLDGANRPVSLLHCVHEKYDPVVASFVGSPGLDGSWETSLPFTLKAAHAANLNACNAQLLLFAEDTSCIADITRARRIVISPGYSGCQYMVFDAGGGVFKCAHTARPGDAGDPDRYVDLMTDYAAMQGWRLVQSIPTMPQTSEPKYEATVIVTRVHYNVNPGPEVRSVRCRLKKGRIIAVTRWIDS